MNLPEILLESSSRHKHLCPRQVLGARMALYAGELLGLELPREDKRLLVTSETDGCAVDGVIAASHCRVGSRTLRILDFGKVAATFTDTHTETSLRIAPQREARTQADEYASHAKNHWEAMLEAYQIMPFDKLFHVQKVCLITPLSEVISKPGKKILCGICGEEVINGREILLNESTLCKSCAGESYYLANTPVFADR
ncbi:MAG TPA: FmdE family protein [Anaerolineales bacterium]|nr:FmdE family protein [Anaerolineales bacterium]HNE03864.1 FmdE family protein [Anaerolineales bacterium]HNM36163.1 FmdE family protein [Anaerolineales bacterium]HNO93596.1 FmdE family protein [Anaerolineales bacterium]